MRIEILSLLALTSLASGAGIGFTGKSGGFATTHGAFAGSKTLGSSIAVADIGEGFGGGVVKDIGVSSFGKGVEFGSSLGSAGFSKGFGASDLATGFVETKGLGLGVGAGLGKGAVLLDAGHGKGVSTHGLSSGVSTLGLGKGISSVGLGHGVGVSSLGLGKEISSVGLGHGVSSLGLGKGVSTVSTLGLGKGVSTLDLGASKGLSSLGLGHSISTVSTKGAGLIPHGYASGFGGGLGAEFHGVDVHGGAHGALAVKTQVAAIPHGDCPHGLERTLYGKCVEPLVSKDLYLYRAPDYKISHKKVHYEHKPKVHYNLVFVRAPSYEGILPKPIVVPPPKTKTLVYVLSKRPQTLSQDVIEVPFQPTKPEVLFVSFNEGENRVLPGGIDLQTALGQSAGLGGKLGVSALDTGALVTGDLHGQTIVEDVGLKGAGLAVESVGFKDAGLGLGSVGFKSSSFGGGSLGLKGSSIGTGSLGFKESGFGAGSLGLKGSSFGTGSLGLKGSSFGAGSLGLKGSSFGSGSLGLKSGFVEDVAIKGSAGGLKHEFVDSIKGGVTSTVGLKGSSGGVGVSYSTGLSGGKSLGGSSVVGLSGKGHGGFVPSKRLLINAPQTKFSHH